MDTYTDERLEKQIENNFKYHTPQADQPERYEALRGQAKTLAHMINALVPNGREKSTSLTKLEECIFHANAGIARFDPTTPALNHSEARHRSTSGA